MNTKEVYKKFKDGKLEEMSITELEILLLTEDGIGRLNKAKVLDRLIDMHTELVNMGTNYK